MAACSVMVEQSPNSVAAAAVVCPARVAARRLDFPLAALVVAVRTPSRLVGVQVGALAVWEAGPTAGLALRSQSRAAAQAEMVAWTRAEVAPAVQTVTRGAVVMGE